MPPKSASGSRPDTGASRPRSGAPVGKKGKAAAPAAATALEDPRAKVELLERSLRSEELTRNYMQLERDKIASFWDVTKHELADQRAEVRLKDRELEEVQDRHALELKVYKQRVKHLLYEHQDGLARLKAAGETALKQQSDLFSQQEAQLGDDKRRLKQHVREQELSSEELIKQFRLDNAKQVSRLRQDFESQARAIQAKYEAQLRGLHQAAEAHYAADLSEVEEAKNAHISELMTRHEATFRDMRAYYAQVTHSNLDLIKALKEEIADMKAAEAAREKLVGDVVRENRRLAEPLAQAVQESDVLRQQVEGAERDRAVLAASKARLAAAEKRARAVEWELEVTQQRLERVERERDDMQRKFDTAVLQAQQRSALRATVLERRLEATNSQLMMAQQGQQQGMQLPPGTSHGVVSNSRRSSAAARVGPGASRAASAARAAGEQGSGSRRGSKAADSGIDWVKAMLQAALHTPLPDQEAEILEDEGPGEVLEQIAELAEAAGAAETMPAGELVHGSASEGPSSSPLAALEAKLSQAVLGAEKAMVAAVQGGGIVEDAAGGLLIPAHRAG